MKFNYTKLAAAALVALAAGGAQAALDVPQATQINNSFGNSSLLFVALDTNSAIAFSADLGLNMISFIQGAARNAPGTMITWNFNTNSSSDVSVTGNAWSTNYATFKSTQAGNDYKWGVIAADSIQGSGSTVTASNAIAGRGWMATGNATVTQMQAANTSSPTGTGLGAATSFWAATANAVGQTHTANNNGSNTAISGPAFGAMGGNFGTGSTWNFLMSNNEFSTFQYQRQIVANPDVFQLGGVPNSADSVLNPLASQFHFDIATNTLTYATPVPEPESYAMLLAGLAAIATMVRRRRKV